MILFHVLQNRAFGFSLALLAKMEKKTTIERSELEELGQQFLVSDIYLEKVLLALEQAGFLSLDKEKGTWISCKINTDANAPKRPLMPMGNIEAEYLQYILRLPEAKLFLDKETRGKLMGETPHRLESIRRLCPTGNTSSNPDPEVFQTVLEAIESNRYICYRYRTKDSNTYTETRCIPWKLEYSTYDHRWWAILYDQDEGRTIKAVLANLKDVKLGDRHRVSQEQILEDMEQLRLPEPVELRIKDERNGLERCFLQFETQEIQYARCIGKDLYELAFTYYKFDKEEIVRKLMQLGPAVTLLGPRSLKNELRSLLLQALEKTRGKERYEEVVR